MFRTVFWCSKKILRQIYLSEYICSLMFKSKFHLRQIQVSFTTTFVTNQNMYFLLYNQLTWVCKQIPFWCLWLDLYFLIPDTKKWLSLQTDCILKYMTGFILPHSWLKKLLSCIYIYIYMPLLSVYNRRLNIWRNWGKETWTRISCFRNFVNLENNFMKFVKQVLKGVKRQGQKDFPLAAHIGGNFTLLRKDEHFDNQIKCQYTVNFQWWRNFASLRVKMLSET